MAFITPGGRAGDATPLGKSGKRRLDDYVRAVAHALMREHGFSRSHAIATAKNSLKRWASGRGKVRPQVRAGAATHLGIQKGIDASLSVPVGASAQDGPRVTMRTMGTLSAKKRRSLPKSQFAIPGQRKYPIPDASHASNALARVAANGTPAQKAAVAAEVRRRFPAMAKRSKAKVLNRGKAASLSVSAEGRTIDLVGPKGYKHGWIYVGGPGLPSHKAARPNPFGRGKGKSRKGVVQLPAQSRSKGTAIERAPTLKLREQATTPSIPYGRRLAIGRELQRRDKAKANPSGHAAAQARAASTTAEHRVAMSEEDSARRFRFHKTTAQGLARIHVKAATAERRAGRPAVADMHVELANYHRAYGQLTLRTAGVAANYHDHLAGADAIIAKHKHAPAAAVQAEVERRSASKKGYVEPGYHSGLGGHGYYARREGNPLASAPGTGTHFKTRAEAEAHLRKQGVTDIQHGYKYSAKHPDNKRSFPDEASGKRFYVHLNAATGDYEVIDRSRGDGAVVRKFAGKPNAAKHANDLNENKPTGKFDRRGAADRIDSQRRAAEHVASPASRGTEDLRAYIAGTKPMPSTMTREQVIAELRKRGAASSAEGASNANQAGHISDVQYYANDAQLNEWGHTPVGKQQASYPEEARRILAAEPGSLSPAWKLWAERALADPKLPAKERQRIKGYYDGIWKGRST